MCECSKIGLNDAGHDHHTCPVASYLFCSICQIQGHSTMKCPDKESWHYRKPEFVEQLIPLSILSNYNINTKTPIVSPIEKNIECIHGNPVIEVPFDEDGKNIRATLSSYNLPSSSVKKNKQVLESFGELIGKKVVYNEPKKAK